MELFIDRFESDFKTRIDQGDRVYLSEIYEELGFEMPLPGHPAYHAFWDKNGFHENDLDMEVSLDQTIMLDDNDAIRRTVDILNGADPLPKKMYTVQVTFEELASLRRIYERKQNETELLKRIINNAALVE